MPANIYRLKDNSIVPGTTTICGILDKPQLIDWAWKLGKEGKDWREERDSAGDIGTAVHKLILDFWNSYLSGAMERSPKETAIETQCFNKFLDWQSQISVEPILIEHQLVSERLKYGGTPDFYGNVNGKKCLIDVKTSGGIYESHWLQLAGYGILLKENGYPVDEYQILWLPKDDRFDAPIKTDLTKEKIIFRSLLNIYKLRRGQ